MEGSFEEIVEHSTSLCIFILLERTEVTKITYRLRNQKPVNFKLIHIDANDGQTIHAEKRKLQGKYFSQPQCFYNHSDFLIK